MHKRLLGAILWFVLLLLVGSGRLLWRSLAALMALRPKTLLVLVSLAVSMSLPNPVRDLLTQAGVWPPGQVISVGGLLALGVGVLWHGLRSRVLKRLRRKLLRSGG
jgi:hypothetical protein